MDKCVAIYLRLSKDDENSDESGSITSQRQIIKGFLDAAPELARMTVIEFVDDGYSGTNFDRPAVKRLLEAVRMGEVCCILVKDLSRFGRQYLEVSRFIEQVFPYLGVRFIAVDDGYDSGHHKGKTAEIDVPIRNMMNALYSSDISKKIRSAKMTQVQNGVFSNAFAPYGYKKDELDRHRLLIDEPAAEIVRRIYMLARKGYRPFQIAGALNSDGILPPALYKKQSGSKIAVRENVRTVWTSEPVSNILRDERYMGTLVGCQHETVQIGSGKKRHKPRDTWIKAPDAIPAIVSYEMWNSLATKRQSYAIHIPPDTSRLLYKKVRCGYCNHICKYVRNSSKSYYYCNTARFTDQDDCSRELYREKPIIYAMQTALQSQISVMADIEKLRQEREKNLRKQALVTQAAMEKLDREIKRRQGVKRQLYERYRGGTLMQTDFVRARESVEADIAIKNAERIALIESGSVQTDVFEASQTFISKSPRYQPIPELSNEAINSLIEAVYLYNGDRIEVRFSFHDEWERFAESL